MPSKPTLIIIGNGISGITAAWEARKNVADLNIKIISEESAFAFSRTALMYIYMGHVKQSHTELYERSFYKKNRLELIQDRVEQIDVEQCRLQLKSGAKLEYDFLLIASGSKPNFFGWPGQNLERVQGLYHLKDLEALEKTGLGQNKASDLAVIVGGGLIGIELAEMLHSRGVGVHFLVRESSYWDNVLPPQESAMINQEISRHGITASYETSLKEIVGDDSGKAVGVIDDKGHHIKCDFVGITAGVHPNIDFLKGSGLASDRGVLVDEYLRTSAPRIYAAGDCAQFYADDKPGHVEQLWYTGKMQARVAGRQIAADCLRMCNQHNKADQIDVGGYDRGVLFNSAKFFTIEYQSYGIVPPVIDPDLTFVWQNQETRQLIRLVWDKQPDGRKTIKGMNALGVRFSQKVWYEWLRDQCDLETVVHNLSSSVFDPEFYKDVTSELQQEFEKVHAASGVLTP